MVGPPIADPTGMDRTWLCSVLFLDIVKYSTQSVEVQMKWKDAFNGHLGDVLRDVPEGERVILDTGDGAAVCFLGAPEVATLAALSLAQYFSSSDLRVRMGINLGPVRLVRDINGALNAIGDGINAAQRVMSFAPENRILVSQSFFEVVSRLSDEYKAMFQLRGKEKDKHVREHTLYYLIPAGSGTAAPGTRSFAIPRIYPRRWLWLAAPTLAIGAWLGVRGIYRPGSVPAIQSIAVLPLDNVSAEPAQDYFAEGMTDELTTELANINKVRVISRGSAMQFKGKQRPSTPEIARILGVDALVEGSVLRAGEKVRITAQLIDARGDRSLWARSFERNSSDVLALQDELASAIAREIRVQLSPAEQTRLSKPAVIDPQAYDAYLRGRYFFNRPSDENLQKAIAKFEEATRLSQGFAPAYSGLSDAYLWAGYNEDALTSSEARPKAKAAAEKAVSLDPNSAEALASLATYKLFYEKDWTGCERDYRHSIALNPNYAFAHDQFVLALSFQGRFSEAIAESKTAAQLDPLSPQILMDSIFAYAWSGRMQDAREQVRKAAELDPTFFFPPFGNAWVDIHEGKFASAISWLKKSKAMGAPSFVSAFLGYAYGISGDRERALAEIEEQRRASRRSYVPAFNLALVELGLGETDKSLDMLAKAYATDSQWLPWLRNDRIFNGLRKEPRFEALLSKLHFNQ
jgi:TolB-like protein/class 3 adenylate cyclase